MTLFINACVRKESRTKLLADRLLAKYDGPVTEIRLGEIDFGPTDEEYLLRRSRLAEEHEFTDPMFELAVQFASADRIVIAAPYWDLSFPAVLKQYFEKINVPGITFDYTPEGIPQGLCRAGELVYVSTAGGAYVPEEFGFGYVKALSTSYYGIGNVRLILAAGLDLDGADPEKILTDCLAEAGSDPASEEPAAEEGGAEAFDHSLDHPDSRYYAMNDYYNMTGGGSLHFLSHFRTYQQTTEFTCGCAAALMVLNHFGNHDYDELDIGGIVGTHPTKGTTVEGLASFFGSLGWNTDFHAGTDSRFDSIGECEQFLISTLDRGTPVMVDWVDWSGHWQVIIGLDTCGTDDPYDDVLIMADSYDITDHNQDGYFVVPLGRFFGMWREGPCADKDEPYLQPFVAACPKE